jgi:hypothetical protein
MNRHSQKGLTTIGWILAIAIFGSIVLTGLKILPMYLDYYNVKTVVDSVANDPEIDPKSKRDLWTAINKRLLINQVRSLKRENVSFVRKDGVTTITVDYTAEKPYIAQLYLVAKFNYTVDIKR